MNHSHDNNFAGSMLVHRLRRWPIIKPILAARIVSPGVNIASRRFLHVQAISRLKEARSRDYALLLFRMTSRVLYSAHSEHAFKQFGALYMRNHDDNHPARPGFEPDTSRLQAPVGTNEPSRPVSPVSRFCAVRCGLACKVYCLSVCMYYGVCGLFTVRKHPEKNNG